MRNRLAAALLILLPCAAFLAPLLSGSFYSFRDLVPYVIPLKQFAAREAAAGRIPWFNPYNGCGEMFLSNPQSGVLYPPTYLFLLPPHAAVQLHQFFHLALAAAGMFLLARAMNRSRPFSLGLGLAFGFSGIMLSAWDLPFNLGATAWLPWVLWGLKRGRPAAVTLALTMSFLAGEPVLFAAHLLTAAVFLWVERLPVRSLGTSAAATGIFVAGQALWLAAGFLQSSRLAAGGENFSGLAWRDLASLVAGPIRGVPFREIPGFSGQTYLPLPYIGTVLLALALGAAFRRGRHRAYLVPVLLFLLLSMGSGGPLAFFFQMPGFGFVRFPTRFLLCALAPLCLLALSAERRQGWALGLHGLLLAGCLATAPEARAFMWVPVAALLLTWFLKWNGYALAFLVLADLAAVAHPIFYVQTRALFDRPPPFAASSGLRAWTPEESATFLNWVYPYGLYSRESDGRLMDGLAGYSNLYQRIAKHRTAGPLCSKESAAAAGLPAREVGGGIAPELVPGKGILWKTVPSPGLVDVPAGPLVLDGSGVKFELKSAGEADVTVRFLRLPWTRVFLNGRTVAPGRSGPWISFHAPAGEHRVEIRFAPAWARGVFLFSGGLWAAFLCYAIIRWIMRWSWRSG